MPEWTPEQKRALELRNINLLVSAAAGSGKTTVMVERILRLALEEGNSLDKMLVVTFTRAAALSMKQKLSKALDLLIEDNPGAERLHEQQKALMFADITTYDSFCVSLLRRYYFLLDISPDFTVLDDCKNELLVKKAIGEVLEEASKEYLEQNSEVLADLTALLCRGKKDTELENAVLAVYRYVRIYPHPDEALKCFLQMYDAPEGQNPWEHSEKLYIKAELEGARICLEKLNQLAGQIDPVYRELYQAICLFDTEVLNNMSACANLKMISACIPKPFLSIPSGKKKCSAELHDEFSKVRNEFKDIVKGAAERCKLFESETLYTDLSYIKGCLATLFELTRRFESRLFELKKADNGLHFDDITHQTVRLLENSEVCAELRAQYNYIFVDEYQDSNRIQEYILSSISRENNLFFVGDVKQSIYRFRQADPALFIEKMHIYTGIEGIKIDLNNNFRSHGDILSAVNLIFSNVMHEDILELEYDASAALYPAPDSWQEKANKAACSCDQAVCEGKNTFAAELMVLKLEQEQGSDHQEEDDSETAELEKDQYEASMLARRIKALLKEPFYDPAQKTCRLPQYRDIVLLLRAANQRADVYQKTFAALGVPLYVQPTKGFLDTFEVSLVLDFLSLLCNQDQDRPLLSVLYSAFYNFTCKELAQIRAEFKSGSFYQACLNYLQTENELSAKLRSFFDSLNRWRFLSTNLPLEDFIWQLYEQTGYIYYISALPLGESRYENLQLLCKRASEYAAREGQNLAGFLNYIRAVLNAGAAMGEAVTLGENDNVVRLMSIHKSKGLEFPVCIVAECGKSFMNKPGNGVLSFHKELGIGAPYRRLNEEGTYTVRESLSQAAIKNRGKQDDRAEELRLLYVAMTRGISRLILSGTVTERDEMHAPGLDRYSMSRANRYFDWILPVLLEHKDANELRALYSYASEILFKDSDWKISVIPSSQLNKIQTEQKAGIVKIKQLLETPPPPKPELQEQYSWRYPFGSAVSLRSKQSVTELSGKAHSVLLKRPFFIQEKNLLPTERGNAYHLFMEKLDTAKTAETELREQLQAFLDGRLFTEAEAEAIKAEQVAAFFASDIGKRLKQAGKVHRETPFTLRFIPEGETEPVLVQGIIDCYFEENGSLVLVDYKTDSVRGNTQQIIERYRSQLALYKQALELITKKQVRQTVLYLFDSQELLFYD